MAGRKPRSVVQVWGRDGGHGSSGQEQLLQSDGAKKWDPRETLAGQKQLIHHRSSVQNLWSHQPFTFLNVYLGLYELHLPTSINITVLEINWGIFKTQEYTNTRCASHQREGHFI